MMFVIVVLTLPAMAGLLALVTRMEHVIEDKPRIPRS
jgi:hypothetical protein